MMLLTWQQTKQELTLLAAGARTANTASTIQTNYPYRGVAIFLDITAASGTGGLTLTIQGRNTLKPAAKVLYTAPGALIAITTQIYIIYPGLAASTGGANHGQGVLPAQWYVLVQHGDASSYTYSVDATLLP